ncbi:glycosyltransferase [bacterium]|nr:glycosyltransferase [bacterium]
MIIKTVDSIDELKAHFGLEVDGLLLETDLDTVENDCELFGRKRRDAEVLCTLAANVSGDCLDLGTSHGRSAYKLATNLSERGVVHTVNILPEQLGSASGQLITHLLTREQIGLYFRERNIPNVRQIYADTAAWEMPTELKDLALVFVDAAHDTDLVLGDSRKVFPRIKEGGFIVWHDFCPELRQKWDWIDASMKGVERFLAEHAIEAEIIHLRNSWTGVLRRTKPQILVVRGDNAVASAHRLQMASQSDKLPPLHRSLELLRYAIVYPAYSSNRVAEEEAFAANARSLEYNVEAIPIFCDGGWWPFPKLDAKWRDQSPDLLPQYEALADRLTTKDVLIASGGTMLHPDFIKSLSTYNVFICADDPESSDILSRPVAPSFDFCFPTNIACLDDYRRWGCRHVNWLFPPVRAELCDPTLTEEKVLSGAGRDLEIVMLCERVFNLSDRAQRLERLSLEFPQAFIRGPGWPEGPIAADNVYPRAQIGWNLHNSVGPCNSRLFTLPAYGVMQICDNKSNLAKIFDLDREVVGFDSIEECVEKTCYYLTHPDERRRIAAAGWKRVMADYTTKRWWEKLASTIAPHIAAQRSRRNESSAGNKTIPDLKSTPELEPISLSQKAPGRRKPRVLLLVDRPNWAYDTAAKAIATRLCDEFEFRIFYVCESPDLNSWPFDLIHVFFWGESYHQAYVKDPRKVIKEISSHRWANEDFYGRLTAPEAAKRYLTDAGTLTATSKRLQSIFSEVRPVMLTPNGFDTGDFRCDAHRSGPLRIGWAGNEKDSCKGVADILRPSAGTDFELNIAGGKLTQAQMRNFYNSVDVLCVASTAEGEPLTLVEGLACGCFPVAVDVGIVPELVQHKVNGLVVERSVAAFRAAFQWCALNTERIRKIGQANAREALSTRSWDVVANSWRKAFREALNKQTGVSQNASVQNAPHDSSVDAEAERKILWDRNLGENLLEWPSRAEAAAQLIRDLDLPAQGRLIDLGCGHQTLRALVPASLEYVPVDRVARRPDVITLDLNTSLPDDSYTVATMLGLVEYFSDVRRLLEWAARHTQYLVLSYNDCSDPARRTRQHWQSSLSVAELETILKNIAGKLLKKVDLGKDEFLYVLEFQSERVECVHTVNPQLTDSIRKRIALLSAAVNGDNSGDALIVDSIRRLLGNADTREFPLLQPLSDAQVEEINACDAAILCGTNLYQHVFACALTSAIIRRIQIPILPLGVGGSAAVGHMPVMDADGIKAVRLLHERCHGGSVRDPLSLEFVRGLGIRNVELTGCPVLFHALREPKFQTADTSRLHLSIRARLLHVNESWNDKARVTLNRLCREFRPTLVLQSPYDLPIADELRNEFGLSWVHDENYRHDAMVSAAVSASRTAGFRLHFGMVSLSYGRPTLLIGTDTRVSSFCDMMGLTYHHIARYDDETLVHELRGIPPDYGRFQENWRLLRNAMVDWFTRNGLACALAGDTSDKIPDSAIKFVNRYFVDGSHRRSNRLPTPSQTALTMP